VCGPAVALLEVRSENLFLSVLFSQLVMCPMPSRRVVSRMEDVSSRGMGSVGLGFKYEDLVRWQDAIPKYYSTKGLPFVGL
jgi:hypothetical protein